jgi:hypothetical protein
MKVHLLFDREGSEPWVIEAWDDDTEAIHDGIPDSITARMQSAVEPRILTVRIDDEAISRLWERPVTNALSAELREAGN